MDDLKKIKVFFFANLPVQDVKASYGGATVLAEQILKYLNNDNRLDIQHFSIRQTWKPKLHLINHFFWIFKFPFAIRKFDVVSFHTTWDFNFSVAPILWLWAKLMNKKIIYHFFGGNFHTQYDSLPFFLKWIYDKTILSSDKVFFETKAKMDYFEQRNFTNIAWLPNARKPLLEKLPKKEFQQKFVFVSRVIPEKGIHEIVAAAEHLSSDYTIDIYGPIDSRYINEDYFDDKKVNYKGALTPSEVPEVLMQYDVMLLPSWFKGEGYPGIVIEALSLGMPVISTYWNSIPEILEDGYNGKLVEIQNSEKLLEAIVFFDIENYQFFRQNAFISFEEFNSNFVFEKLKKSYLNA